jgi:transposase-like protein
MVKGTKKRKYTREFREAAVRLVTVEKVPAAQAAADLGMPVNTLGVWISQSRHFKGSFTPPGGVDWEKKARELEVENRRLKLERDILTKATAFFVRENGGQP